MRQWTLAVILTGALATVASAAGKGPEIQIVDNKLSINAEAVSLGRLLRLLDLATGMQSKVPPELANRNISVRFSGLSVDEGVRKIFQGQPLDYILIQGQGVVVTAVSQTLTASENVPVYSPSPQVEQPFFPENPVFSAPQPPQPIPQPQGPVVQTPFGPMPTARVPQPAQPNAPLSAPGQQNSLFPQVGPQSQPAAPPNLTPGIPGSPIPVFSPTPFGVPSTFGTAPVPVQNDLFGGQVPRR
jgi:hypothetical protein